VHAAILTMSIVLPGQTRSLTAKNEMMPAVPISKILVTTLCRAVRNSCTQASNKLRIAAMIMSTKEPEKATAEAPADVMIDARNSTDQW
jgi:hypothetical protein